MSALIAESARSYRCMVCLDAEPGSAEPHGSGGLSTWGTARTVGVLDYPDLSPPRSEFVGPEELFDEASMASAIGVVLTLGHPPIEVDDGLVTPDTYRSLGHGSVAEVARRGDDLRMRVILGSREALDAYAAGVRELSAAYQSAPRPESGEHNGRAYQFRQGPARYNALAIVPAARAGHTARLDAAPQDTPMKLKIRKLTRDVPQFVADSITAQAETHRTAAAALDKVRRDALEVEEVMLRDTTLILPTATVDQIVAMLGGEATETETETTAETEIPLDSATPPDPNAPKEKDPTRMDAKTLAALQPAIAAEVARQVAAKVQTEVTTRLDAAHRLEQRRHDAAPLLPEGYDPAGKSEHDIAADAVIRADAAAKEDVERLQAAANKGDQRAAGKLDARLDAAIRSHQDAGNTAGGIALAIDDARRTAPRQDAERPEAPKPVNRTEAARQKALARGVPTRGARA